jgi:hypothetical protein
MTTAIINLKVKNSGTWEKWCDSNKVRLSEAGTSLINSGNHLDDQHKVYSIWELEDISVFEKIWAGTDFQKGMLESSLDVLEITYAKFKKGDIICQIPPFTGQIMKIDSLVYYNGFEQPIHYRCSWQDDNRMVSTDFSEDKIRLAI